MPAKKLTEANCRPRYSCSKLLLVYAIFIWFSDRMLFTLTTRKTRSMASCAAKNTMLEQKRFLRATAVPAGTAVAVAHTIWRFCPSVFLSDWGVTTRYRTKPM